MPGLTSLQADSSNKPGDCKRTFGVVLASVCDPLCAEDRSTKVLPSIRSHILFQRPLRSGQSRLLRLRLCWLS